MFTVIFDRYTDYNFVTIVYMFNNFWIPPTKYFYFLFKIENQKRCYF